MFFSIVGFLFLLAITLGPAAYILYLGHWQRQFGGRYPLGAVLAAAVFALLGFVVICNAPFHITLTP